MEHNKVKKSLQKNGQYQVLVIVKKTDKDRRESESKIEEINDDVQFIL